MTPAEARALLEEDMVRTDALQNKLQAGEQLAPEDLAAISFRLGSYRGMLIKIHERLKEP